MRLRGHLRSVCGLPPAVGAAALALLAAQPAYAHDQSIGLGPSLQQGFMHPITGIDHLLAMVAVGLLSAVMGGRAIIAVPATFVAALLVGGVFGFYGYELVGVELWIVGSLLILGVVLATVTKPGRAPMYAAIALFGFAHGNAHGLELPLASSAAGYAAGFALASALCHASGIAVGLGAARTPWGRTPIRILGILTCAMAIYLAPSMVLAG